MDCKRKQGIVITMSELLLELFYEEIPYIVQMMSEVHYKEIFTKYFQINKIKHENIEVYSTPRRITIFASGVDTILNSTNKEFKGPKVDGEVNAIQGFCKSHNISKEDLTIKEKAGQKYYFYIQNIHQQLVSDLLMNDLPTMLKEYTFAKSMYWGEYNIIDVRPLRNIMCLFDNKTLAFQYGHLTANNITHGHRFIGKQNIIVNSFADYKEVLRENYVILNQNERKEIIKRQIEEITTKYNLIINEDKGLMDEVVGLVEWPVVMIGKINEKFLNLPKEVLITTMRNHQKYFSLFDSSGNFAPYFLFVSNLKSSNPNIIIEGNEKVLEARLSDALYFYELDIKSSLESFLPKLEKMNFHAKLGNMKEKTMRVGNICKYLYPENEDLIIASKIYKSDLVSTVVNELPELQGVMGYYYALNEGYNQDIAHAIKYHYNPQGPTSAVPTATSGKLALVDKLDSLVGLMLAGEAPNGSKDPFALRRSALGIIRIILDNQLSIEIVKLIQFIIKQYSLTSNVDEKDIIAFLEERIKNYFKNEYEQKVIIAVLNLQNEPNLIKIIHKFEKLKKFLETDEGQSAITAYKRINNILHTHSELPNLNEGIFVLKEEKELFQCLSVVEDKIDQDFVRGLKMIVTLINPINDFFDNVLINDKNVNIANNRLVLLYNVKLLFNRVVNFDVL